MNEHLLTLIIVFPFLGAITILFLPRAKSDIAKIIAAVVTGIQLWIAVQIFFNFDRASTGMQFLFYSLLRLLLRGKLKKVKDGILCFF